MISICIPTKVWLEAITSNTIVDHYILLYYMNETISLLFWLIISFLLNRLLMEILFLPFFFTSKRFLSLIFNAKKNSFM